MLNIFGKTSRREDSFCDGMARRSFLKVGGMACGGLSLAQLLRAEALDGRGSNHRAIINIYMPGGP